MIILWAVLWLLTALLLALLAVLALPIRLRLFATSAPVRRIRLELGLLGGLVPRIALVDSARAKTRQRPERPRKPEKPGRPARMRRRPGRARRWAGRMLRAGPDLLTGLLRQFRVERLRADCAFGLGDPAETGELFGVIGPWLYGSRWAWADPGAVRLTPVFDRACLEGEAEAVISVVPLRLIPPAVAFGWAVWGPAR